MDSSKGLQKQTRKRKIDTPVEKVEAPVKTTKQWVIDGEGKMCPVCGAVMRGWAVREKFQFCPMCGERLD